MSVKKKKTQLIKRDAKKDYEVVLSDMVSLLEEARRTVARSVNAVMTATYWEVGRRIVEIEQRGKKRSDYYGEEIIERLSEDLTARFGRGFGRRNLFQMRAFYLSYSKIVQTLPAQSFSQKKKGIHSKLDLTELAKCFPLSWSHYVELFSAKSELSRSFYEEEALRGGWSIRQLKRQMNSQFYERTLLSKNKAAMLTKGAKAKPEDKVTPEEEIKDPFVLEFLNLKDECSESDLEEALIKHLEAFLLELGTDFTFVGRQKRLRVGDEWFRVDLVFFHRRLRCLVLIDLKLSEFNYADVGQIILYTNYAREHWTNKDENPPIGLILCDKKNEAVAKYTLDNLPNKILAAEYRSTLPDEKLLEEEIRKTRRLLSERANKKKN